MGNELYLLIPEITLSPTHFLNGLLITEITISPSEVVTDESDE